ncbi:hypothetical protein JMJ35_005171 [Cladonia borealis]|uniref:Uncharacterized protein n=1 Tax=Cladonia borealis TaxID=184061 RepID=A0AA39QZH1_9LECA|nr:hypothetical protein JMJ35_005171 [Cladonia borealis]
MSDNAAPRRSPKGQHEQSSDSGGLEVGRGHAMSSQRSHENRSQHDGHVLPDDSSTTSGSSRVGGNWWRGGGRNEQGDVGHLQPGEEKKSSWTRFKAWAEQFDEQETFTSSSEYDSGEKERLLERNYQLREKIDQQAGLISKLRSDVEKEVEKCKEIKQSADRMAYAMEQKELSIGRQDSDLDIHTRFRSLVGQIKTWSVPFAQIHQDVRAYSAETIEEFRKVCPGVSDFERFLQTPRNLRLLVRGYVGLVVAGSLFRTIPYPADPRPRGEDVWMDRELAHSFASIEKSFFHSNRKLISYRDLHDWRALTATLISRLGTYNKTDESTEMGITACSRRIMSLVAIWVAAEDRRMLEDGLQKILSDAVELSQTLRCQRAFWSIRLAGSFVDRTLNAGRVGSLLYFDEGTMDDKHGDEDSDGRSIPTSSQKAVEIIITPSLWKCGNTDGERYDLQSCVERSEVKCKRPLPPRHP